MLDVIIALIPAGVVSIWKFGVKSLWVILLAVISSVLTEYIVQKLTKKTVTINDFSSAVTGLLLAYNLPPGAPWWMVIIGSVIAIALVKHAFGGLGHNFMNPALAARAVLMACWPVHMTNWISPGSDAVSSATPLVLRKISDAATSATSAATSSATSGATAGATAASMELPSLLDVIIGNIPGSLGEISSAALLIGAAYLLYRGVINWRIPFTYHCYNFCIDIVYQWLGFYDAFYQLFLGGLILGAFYGNGLFILPVTSLGQIIMGIGCGILTTVIWEFGGYPRGQLFILLMNVATPLIEKYTMPKIFGVGSRV